MRRRNPNEQAIGGRMTPQQKIMLTNNKFGNNSIKNQQGSTIIKYDTLPLDGRTDYRFFEGSAQRNFPFANTGTDGNKLGVGETMVVQRAYLSIVTKIGVADPISVVTPVTVLNPELATSEFSFVIANTTVIKNLPVLSWLPEFNKDAENALNSSYEFDTMVTIPPLLEYEARIQTSGIVSATQYLRLTIEGVGSLVSPRASF